MGEKWEAGAESASETERSGNCIQLRHYYAGYGGERRRLAGLGYAHIGPNAKQDKGIFQAKLPLAGEEIGCLAAGLAHRLGEVCGRAVSDPGFFRLAYGPGALLALQEVEAGRHLAG